MTNIKNVKQISRLTGALLAKKGAAAPTAASRSMPQQALNCFSPSNHGSGEENSEVEIEQNLDVALENMSSTIPQDKNEKAVKWAASVSGKKVLSKNTRGYKSSKEPEASKRIAMTLRMETEDHLKLRIFSAHTRKSCQVILSEALELYFEHNNDKVQV